MVVVGYQGARSQLSGHSGACSVLWCQQTAPHTAVHRCALLSVDLCEDQFERSEDISAIQQLHLTFTECLYFLTAHCYVRTSLCGATY